MCVEDPDKPFICDPTVKLDENELAILAKGPKFLVRDELNASEFNLEVESMVAKKKYDTVFNDKDDLENENCSSMDRAQVHQSDNNKQLNETNPIYSYFISIGEN